MERVDSETAPVVYDSFPHRHASVHLVDGGPGRPQPGGPVVHVLPTLVTVSSHASSFRLHTNASLRRPNVPLSAFTTAPTVPLDTHTPYVPPHPQRGTPYHRYVLLMLPQASPTEPIDIPVFQESERLGFNFRAFAEQYGFDGSRGGGAHMWREEWDETVSHIYQHTLSELKLVQVYIAELTCLRPYREGGAAVRQDTEDGPVRGTQADEKVPLDASSAPAHIHVVTPIIRCAFCFLCGWVNVSFVWMPTWNRCPWLPDFDTDLALQRRSYQLCRLATTAIGKLMPPAISHHLR